VFRCSEEEKSVKIVNSISHHRNCILTVSSFGKLAVSGSSDGEIALWGADNLPHTGTTPLHSFKVHQGGVTSLVMTTETEFISGGDDGTFQVNNFTDGRFQAIFVSQLATQITGKFKSSELFTKLSAFFQA
jgi:WD40 repeat protein